MASLIILGTAPISYGKFDNLTYLELSSWFFTFKICDKYNNFYVADGIMGSKGGGVGLGKSNSEVFVTKIDCFERREIGRNASWAFWFLHYIVFVEAMRKTKKEHVIWLWSQQTKEHLIWITRLQGNTILKA